MITGWDHHQQRVVLHLAVLIHDGGAGAKRHIRRQLLLTRENFQFWSGDALQIVFGVFGLHGVTELVDDQR